MGKSTLTLQLAGYASSKGLRVLIIDLDTRQRSCFHMASKGRVPFEVICELPSKKPYMYLLIIDTKPGIEAKIFGTVVMPFRPAMLDFQQQPNIKNFRG